MTINKRVKLARKSLGLTLDEFGSHLNISGPAISLMENEKSGVSERNIKAIVKEFSVSESWLRTGEGDMFVNQKPDEEISAFMGELLNDSPDFKKAFISILARMTEQEWTMLEEKVHEITRMVTEIENKRNKAVHE